MNFLASASAVKLMPDGLGHCDCTGQRGLPFDDCVEEVNSQLKTRNLSQLLSQPPPPRSSHRLFKGRMLMIMKHLRQWQYSVRGYQAQKIDERTNSAQIFRAELCALEVTLTPGYMNIQLDCLLQEMLKPYLHSPTTVIVAGSQEAGCVQSQGLCQMSWHLQHFTVQTSGFWRGKTSELVPPSPPPENKEPSDAHSPRSPSEPADPDLNQPVLTHQPGDNPWYQGCSWR